MIGRVGTAILLLGLCIAAVGAAEGRPDSRIVFVVNRSGYGEIWTMAPTGNDRRRLSARAHKQTDAAGSGGPRWSPSGRHIAYVFTGAAARESPDDAELYVMRADGSGARRLTRNRLLDASPTWSPNGRRLAFLRYWNWGRSDAHGSIVVIDVATRRERVLRFGPASDRGSFITHLAWSPDGSEIALTFATFRDDGSTSSEIRLLPASGGASRLLVTDGAGAAWSPDGRWLAFQSGRDRFGRTCFHDCNPSPEIYVIARDGSGLRRITHNPAYDGEPAWSPDGASIAFTSDRSQPRSHAYEIYVMPADGGSARRLTRNAVWDRSPDWR